MLFLCNGLGTDVNGLGRKGNKMTKFKRSRAEARKHGFCKMNLQLFAEGDDSGADGGNGGGAGGEGDGGDGNQEPKSFDDVLKNKDYQAEFDRRVNKAIETAKSKWDALMDDKLTEAEKMAKMTKEEKAAYQQKKQEKELADREAAITRRELMAEAKNTLAEKNLPVDLAEVLNYADADSCKKSLETVEKAFQKAVQAGVEARLKGDKPLKKAGQTDEMSELEKQIYESMKG